MIRGVELRPEYPVTTARLRLRPLTIADVPALVSYRGRADICRYLPFEPMTEAVVRGRLAGDFARTELTQPGQGLTLGVESTGVESAGGAPVGGGPADGAPADGAPADGAPADGQLIGDVVLMYHSAEHRAGEIGYVFGPQFHGHGYATEAVAALLDLAFGGLGLHRVVARLDARNVASARLAERLGLRREAHFVSNEMFKGEWSDEFVYAMLADDWRSRPVAVSPRSGSSSQRWPRSVRA